MNITKEQFNRYEGCRLSGATNMFDLTKVKLLTGLNKEQITTIMNNYDELSNKKKIFDLARKYDKKHEDDWCHYSGMPSPEAYK